MSMCQNEVLQKILTLLSWLSLIHTCCIMSIQAGFQSTCLDCTLGRMKVHVPTISRYL